MTTSSSQYGALFSPSFWRPRFQKIRTVIDSNSTSVSSQISAIQSLGTIMGDTTSIEFYSGSKQDQERVVLAWVDAEILEMLESLVGIVSRIGDERMEAMGTIFEVATIFMYINHALKTNRNSTLEALYPHLARPRLLRSLPNRDLNTQVDFPPSPGRVITLSPCYGEISSMNHNLHWPYVTLFVLHSQRFARPECGKRGCTVRGVSQCSACKRVRYCTAQCQKEDWAEHKLICGLRIWLDDRELGRPEDQSQFESEEWPLEEKRCGTIRLMFPGKVKRKI